MPIRHSRKNNTLMQIMDLTKELASVASHIYAKSWKTAYKDIIPQKYLDELSLEHWTPFLENSPFQNFLLQDNGVFVAASAIAKAREGIYDDYGEVVSIYVLPDHFNKGYGTILFKHMIEKLQAMGFSKTVLWVLEENQRARLFYEKMGFKANNDKKVCKIGGKALTEVCYVNTEI